MDVRATDMNGGFKVYFLFGFGFGIGTVVIV